jgi:hypothetical protein
MAMTAGVRKLALTAHVTFSVGWLGALAGFLALSIVGLASTHMESVRSSYLSMELLGRFVIVPLSFAALATGILQALGTEWGLTRYYWVLAKLVLSLFATFVLLLHQFTAVADAAKIVSDSAAVAHPAMGGIGIQMVANAGGGLLVLIVITALSIFKPWGPTRFGRRHLASPRLVSEQRMPKALKIVLVIIAVLAAAFAILHLAGGGLGHHAH